MKTLDELKEQFGKDLQGIKDYDDYVSLASNFIRMVTWKKIRELEYISEQYPDLITEVITDVKENGYFPALYKIKLNDMHKAYSLRYMREYYKKYKISTTKLLEEKNVELKIDQSFPKGKKFVKDVEKGNNKIAGTSQISDNKKRSGFIAEKKCIDFLSSIGASIEDVADDIKYHFDILFKDARVGLEVKNIENGSFFVSENEIRQYESGKTRLCFVDKNSIWMSKHIDETMRFKTILSHIREIDSYIIDKYDNHLKSQAIEVSLTEELEKDFFLVNHLDLDQLIDKIKPDKSDFVR